MGFGGQAAATLTGRGVRGRGVLGRGEWQVVRTTLRLSPRQFEVMQHLFDDLPEAQIALSLGISPHTVHTYVRQIYGKLGACTRSEMLVRVFGIVLAARDEQAGAVDGGKRSAAG
jgi:DNA-binding CsgD family transcriptional regulator